MTTDFARARLNMVNAQLLTNGIHNPDLIEAYMNLPRERLVDDAQRPHVYMDEDLPIDGGKRWLLDPLVEARLVQEAIREPAASALVLSAANLPALVMLASFVPALVALEPDANIAAHAQKRLIAQDVTNIVLIETGYKEGYPRQAPYDVIFVPGAVSYISPLLTDQLALGGRLVCVLRETPRAQGRIVVVHRLADGTTNTTTIADAATPYLAGFEPTAEFVF